MKIFISHQRKDNTIVNRITEIFKKYDIDYWVDIEEMYSEFDDFRAKIKKGMRECTHFLLIWSSSAKESEYVQEEAKQAISKGDNFHKFSIKIDETDFGKGTFKKFSDYFYLKGTLDNLEENLLDLIFEKISKNLLFDSQINIYKDKIKYDFEHFEKYSSADDRLSVKSFKKFDTYNEFVSQRCKLSNNDIKENILIYVINLINDNLSNFIPIVGGYGSGKSLLMFYILYSLCKQPTKNGITIPLFIPLGKLNKLRNDLDFKERIYEYISKEYKITDKESYYKHLQSSNIIFLLDAFDEISTTIDSNLVNKNIENIKSLLPNKIVITSRNTYLTRNIEKNFIHDSNLIEILDFDNQNINDFVNNKFKHNKIKIRKSELFKILDKPDIKKFTHKPLFLQIICDKHSEFQNRAITNPAVIFEILTKEWIIHDVNKNHNIDANKKEKIKESRQRISESLAYYSNGLGSNQSVSNEAISITEIKQQIDKEFDLELKSKIGSSELFQFYHDAQNSTFLIKEAREANTDTFSFLHKSIIEYFLARRIVNYINENFNEINSEYILSYSQQIKTLETFEFIKYIAEIEWKIDSHTYDELQNTLKENEIYANIKTRLERQKNFYETIEYFKRKSNNEDPLKNPNIGNLVSILYSTTDFAKFSFTKLRKNFSFDPNLNFRQCNLNGVRMPYSDLSYSNLTCSNFTKANLTHSNLSNADLSSAKCTDADLSFVDFSHAILSNVDFWEVTLNHVNFKEANLSNAHISESPFEYANLSHADLNHAILDEATFYHSLLTKANLSYTDLLEARFDFANFQNADLSYADLTSCFLEHANFSDANLSNSILIKVKDFKYITFNENTKFNNAITNDFEVVEFIRTIIPKIQFEKIEDEQTLRNSLQQHNFDEKIIEKIINYHHRFDNLPLYILST